MTHAPLSQNGAPLFGGLPENDAAWRDERFDSVNDGCALCVDAWLSVPSSFSYACISGRRYGITHDVMV
jgi:hypothetical protein